MKYRIHKADFLKSAAGKDGWPSEICPETAFAGRSNVGKSSLINTLLGRKAIVRVSSTPGRTRLLNFVDVSVSAGQVSRSSIREFRMVDLPGYGYAKVSKKERRAWGPMVQSYISERKSLAAVILVVDSRIEPTEADCIMADWLRKSEKQWFCVITKTDKLPKNKKIQAVRQAEKTLGLSQGEAVAFSAVDGLGREEIWERMIPLLNVDFLALGRGN